MHDSNRRLIEICQTWCFFAAVGRGGESGRSYKNRMGYLNFLHLLKLSYNILTISNKF